MSLSVCAINSNEFKSTIQVLLSLFRTISVIWNQNKNVGWGCISNTETEIKILDINKKVNKCKCQESNIYSNYITYI